MRIGIVIFFYFICHLSFGQGFRTRHCISQASQGFTKDVFEIGPGNYVCAGYAVDTSSGYERVQIVMMGLNSYGQIQWVKKHHGGNIEYYTGMTARTFYKQGNYIYYAGCAHDSDGVNPRAFGVFLKYNLSGDTLWRKIYWSNDSLEDLAPQMVTGSVDGGFLITGCFQHWGNHVSPTLVLKTDANGNELWRKKINKANPNTSDGKAIMQDSASKKIVIVGYMYIGSSNIHPHILILDSLGTKKYQGKFYNDQGADALDLVQTRDKKFVVIGRKSYTHIIEMPDFQRTFAIKFDIDNPATPIWIQDSVNTLNNDDVNCAAVVLPNGDIMLGGQISPLLEPDGATYAKIGLVQKFTILNGTDGKIKSSRRYSYYSPNEGLQYYQGLNSFNLCSDKGWIAAIGSNKYPGVNPFFIVKYDSTGCDSTLAYCAFVNSGLDEFQTSDSKFQVYPNPFSNELYVINEFSQQQDDSELTIIDVNGREVKRASLSGNKISTSVLIPGIYLLQIRKNGEMVYKSKIIRE